MSEVKQFDELKVGDNLYTWEEHLDDDRCVKKISMVELKITKIQDESDFDINQRFYYVEPNALNLPSISVKFDYLDWCVAVCAESGRVILTDKDELREEVNRRYKNYVNRMEQAIETAQNRLDTIKENSKNEDWL